MTENDANGHHEAQIPDNGESGAEQGGSSIAPHLKPYRWVKGQSGNPKGRRYAKFDLQHALNVFMHGDERAWSRMPKPVQQFITMWYERVLADEPGFLKEWNQRWQGAVPKQTAAALPRPVIVLQPLVPGPNDVPVLENRPVGQQPPEVEGTPIHGSNDLKSRTNGHERRRPSVMPALEPNGSVQHPVVFEPDDDDDDAAEADGDALETDS